MKLSYEADRLMKLSHSVVFALHSKIFKMVVVEVFTFILKQEHLVLLLLKRLYKNILYFFATALGVKGKKCTQKSEKSLKFRF